MNDNVVRMRHFGIVTDVLEQSLVFYRDRLGFSVTVDQREDSAFIDRILLLRDSALRTIKLAGPDGSAIELLDFRTPSGTREDWPPYRIGPTHIAVQVRSAAAFYEEMSAEGVPFLSPPARSADGRALVAFCRAPEGTYVEIVEMLE